MRAMCWLAIVGAVVVSLGAAAGFAGPADTGARAPVDLTPRDVEPTAAETLILEYTNRARANPAAEAQRLLAMAKGQRGVDTAMFVREMNAIKAAPPLVFDPRLIWVARAHSRYQIAHGQGHYQVAGKGGFFGVQLKDRLRYAQAGYRAAAENCFVYSRNPWHGHGKFVIDTGSKGSGGMQAGRGHRVNIYQPSYRLIGISWVQHTWKNRTRYAITQDFVRRSGRYAGGVIYTDRNGNGFYDIGEGLSGATVTVGSRTVKAWASGAYTIPIPQTRSQIIIRVAGKVIRTPLPAGTENVKSDAIVPSDK